VVNSVVCLFLFLDALVVFSKGVPFAALIADIVFLVLAEVDRVRLFLDARAILYLIAVFAFNTTVV